MVLIVLALRRTSASLAGHVTFLSAKYSKELLPVGKTIHCRGMKMMQTCPQYIIR